MYNEKLRESMPPKFDPKLEGRILKAAARLWRTRGEEGLTLRAVAREAGTSTPTVYKRFRNKQALRLALAEQFYGQIMEQCFTASSLEEVFRRYVRFAEEHPNEYRLLWDSWTQLFRPESPRPFRAWVLSQMASRYGGKPEEYLVAFFAFVFLSHGAAMLLTVPGEDSSHNVVHVHFPAILDAVLKNPNLLLK